MEKGDSKEMNKSWVYLIFGAITAFVVWDMADPLATFVLIVLVILLQREKR